MAWPLSEPMLVSLLTHICVTRPQWVNGRANIEFWSSRKMKWRSEYSGTVFWCSIFTPFARKLKLVTYIFYSTHSCIFTEHEWICLLHICVPKTVDFSRTLHTLRWALPDIRRPGYVLTWCYLRFGIHVITVRCRYNALTFLTNIGEPFVDPASDWYSASVPVIIYAIS